MWHKDTLKEKHVKKRLTDLHIHAHNSRKAASIPIPPHPSGTEIKLQIAEGQASEGLLHIIDMAAHANIDWS